MILCPNSKDSKEKQENGGSAHILISQLQAALYNLSRRFGVSSVDVNSLRKSNYYFSLSCAPSLRGLADKRRASSPPASPPPRWAAAGTASEAATGRPTGTWTTTTRPSMAGFFSSAKAHLDAHCPTRALKEGLLCRVDPPACES